jgi:chaperonin cofactor prefoldin
MSVHVIPDRAPDYRPDFVSSEAIRAVEAAFKVLEKRVLELEQQNQDLQETISDLKADLRRKS